MRFNRGLVVALGLLPLASALAAHAVNAAPASRFMDGGPGAGDVHRAVAERVTAEVEKQAIVGLSVGLVIDGVLARTLHVGFEDRERGIAASDRTMYRWASISKPLTAIVAMIAASEGRLDLDRDIRELVPEFPEKPWPITGRQLLTHQGGIVHYTNGRVIRTRREYAVEHPFADAILALDMFKESPLVCEPGTRHAYTTHGYMLLAAVVERAMDSPYTVLVRERIALPLGMTTLRPDYQWEDIPNRAIGYRRRLGEIIPSTDTDVSWKLGGGGWISNVEDLARLAKGLMSDDMLPESTREAMWTRQTTRDGVATNYGLGFTLGELDGTRLVGHGGSQEKTRTSLLIAPDHRAAVAIMCNSEFANLGALTRDVLRLLLTPRMEADHHHEVEGAILPALTQE
jgi:CubicO group peptidase (beta-lactamase class C family)